MKRKLIIFIFLMFCCNIFYSQIKPEVKIFANQNRVNLLQSRAANCNVDTILITTQAQIDNFNSNFPTCTAPKYLIINGEGASPAITNLTGLSSLTAVINKLEIRNTNITNLAALNNIDFIGDTLLLERNNLMTSIGLNNLDTLGAIYFAHLPMLNSVAGLCNNIHKTGLIKLDSTNLSNLTGLHTIDSLTTPNGGLTIAHSPIVDVAVINNLKYIQGYLILSNNNLQTSTGLTNLENIWGFLFDGLPLLNSVAGLTNNLTNSNIGTFWFFNTGISSLVGLEGLTNSSNFYISGNHSLTSLNGLQNLAGNIPGGISMFSNSMLNDIAALKNITATSIGTIEISYLPIASLNGLKNVTNIGKGLWLVGNTNLTNLDSLHANLVIHNNEDAFSLTKDSVRILDNTNLSVCTSAAICNYLAAGNSSEISNNATGCNNVLEINTACANLNSNNDVEDNCCINNAIALNENEEKLGNVGLYDLVNNYYIDEFDTYRIVLHKAGAIKINVTSSIDSCDNNELGVELLDKLGNSFSGEYHNVTVFNTSNCTAILNDSIRITALEADTFYLRLKSNYKLNYKIKYQLLDSSATDTEPNNTYANAVFLATADSAVGRLNFKRLAYSDYDFADNYKVFMPNGGNVRVIIKSTYKGKAPHFFTNTDYTCTINNVISGESYNSVIPYGTIMNYDDVRYDTLQFCAIIGDTVYLKLQAGIAMAYEMKYEVTQIGLPQNDVEPNNDKATAIPIAYNEVKQGLLRAVAFNTTGSVDFEDYYRAVLPKNGKLRIVSTGNNISCNSTNNFTIEVLRNGQISTPPIAPSYTVGDTLYYCSLLADAVYFKLSAYYPFAYSIKYDMIDTIVVNDIEPNNATIEAVAIAKGDTKKGTLSFKNNLFEDVNDYYKVILNCPDTLKLTSIFTNKSCDFINNFYVGTAIDLYTKNGTLIGHKGIPNLAAGQVYYDTTAFPIVSADTFYVTYKQNALGSNIASLGYEFSIKNSAPSASFTIAGGDSACLGSKTYMAENICGTGYTYHWSVSGGGTLTSVNDVATVNWTTPGTHTISLYISNSYGASATKNYTVHVIPTIPTTPPTIIANGRNLSTALPPDGIAIQWYKSGILSNGANSTTYFAADSGTYTVRYTNYCGATMASNSIYFALPLQNQTISFNTLTPNFTYALNAFAIINAVASSNLPVVYSIVSGLATIVLDSLKAAGAGTVIIAANQPGNINYNVAPTKYDTIQITQGLQTITFNNIANKKYSDTTFTLGASSNVGLPITYMVVSGNANINGNIVTMTGAGTVTIQATQNGNSNYSAATPVSQSFCIGIRELGTIQGEAQPCLGTYKYTVKKVTGANYIWTLSSGGTITFNNDTATIIWTAAGTHTITVKANSSCDATYSTIHNLVITTSNNVPLPVCNMLPINNAINQQLPLNLSWIPGQNTVNYDLYIWRSDTLQPALPFATNITGTFYTIPQNSLAFNKTYNWLLVSKNPCNQLSGPTHQFSTIPLPDLEVFNVQAPSTAFSGQNITINWSVKNNGPGKITTNQSWYDYVYLSYDSINPFAIPANTNPGGWAIFSGSNTLLVNAVPNLTALDSGQQYTNTQTFYLPVATSQSLFAYVITNGNNGILETTKINDTARAAKTVVTLSPTPDVRVDSVFAPNTLFSGNTINVTYKVKNYGTNTPANNVWTDKFYISNTAVFDVNNATALKAPKANGTYYYNQPTSEVFNNFILKADSVYTKSQQLVIPNFINGTYFIHVVTNATNTMYEGAASNNNTANKQIQVIITPTPKLQVFNLNITADTLSNTQPFNINYSIVNNGFYDNIEKNQGHYAVRNGTCQYSPPLPPNCNSCVSVNYPSISLRDSLGFGSSAWSNNIYLSTDSTGLNSANATLISALPQFYNNQKGMEDLLVLGCQSSPNIDPVFVSRNIASSLSPNKIFPTTTPTAIPANLPAGKYYVYVWGNADKGVYEYPNTNEIKRSAFPIVIQNPDLIIPSISPGFNAYAGQNIAINYTVSTSNSINVFNAPRRDMLYVSNSAVFDNTAVLLNTQTYSESVSQNTLLSKSFNYVLPNTATGTLYFYVVTNGDNLILESNIANNRNSVAVTISIPPANLICDLQINSIVLADSIFTKLPNALQYTVINTGVGATQGTWVDSLFVSCSATFNPATATFVGAKQQNRTIVANNSYTDVINFTTDFAHITNPCFPVQQFNNAYFFIKTNANNAVLEGVNIANNITATSAKVLINSWPDYIVTKVNSSVDTTIVGRPFPVTWTLKNLKYTYQSNYLIDAVYFSTDSVFNANAVLANDVKSRPVVIVHNQTYDDAGIFATPNLSTGDYYVFVKTNDNNQIYNENLTNNTNLIRNVNGAAKKIHVIKLPLPDFTDTITDAPSTINIGQPITIKAKITNIGLGANYPPNFSNTVWLNTNFEAAGYQLTSTNKSVTLNAGQHYNDSVTFTIPTNIAAGNYILVWKTNSTNNVIETNNSNNLAFKYITVVHPTPVDLVVNTINIPDTATLGYTINNVEWIVHNNATNAVVGSTNDGLYISKSNIFDSAATLLKIEPRYLQMAPLQYDTVSKQVLVNNVAEGYYNILVKADVLNNIIETNKNNNVTKAAKQLYVKVNELPFNVVTPTTLNNEVYRYYKLKIPDSLRGSTIQVILKTTDSLTRTNQLYIGAGYVPNPAHFDYKFSTPNYGNQDIVMTSVNDSLYYITVRNVNSNVAQNISLQAVKLPFTILNVQKNSGGNTGNVTVRIDGNLFNNSMVAKLRKGADSITATTLYYINSTTVYATFNLAAKPLGVFNVEVFKTSDSTLATLPNAFTIVPTNNGGLITGSGTNGIPGKGTEPGCDPNAASGLNSQLVTEIIAPEKIFVPFPYEVRINFTNPTNVDIPAQTKILYVDNNIKMALTQAGLAMGTNSLYITFTEPGGPPGIIRAGGSGTIVVHCKAPNDLPGHTFIHYNLK